MPGTKVSPTPRYTRHWARVFFLLKLKKSLWIGKYERKELSLSILRPMKDCWGLSRCWKSLELHLYCYSTNAQNYSSTVQSGFPRRKNGQRSQLTWHLDRKCCLSGTEYKLYTIPSNSGIKCTPWPPILSPSSGRECTPWPLAVLCLLHR